MANSQAHSVAGQDDHASGADRAPRAFLSRDFWVKASFVLPGLLYLFCLSAYPIFYNGLMSLQHFTVASFLNGAAPFVGFANYVDLFRGSLFVQAFWRTLIFSALSIAGQMGAGMALALFFWRPFPLSRPMLALLLVPWLLPLVVSSTVFRWMFDQDAGILNYALSHLHIVSERLPWLTDPTYAMASVVINNIWVGIPFSTIVFLGGLRSLPNDIFEAAQIDGAGAWQRFWHITLPSLRPLTGVVFALSVTYTVKVFDLIFILTAGGPANATQTLATYTYKLSFEHMDFGHGAAVGNFLILISLGFSLFYLRSVRRGAEDAA